MTAAGFDGLRPARGWTVARVLWWSACSVPALVALAWVVCLGIDGPEPADVLRYRGDAPLVFRWDRVVAIGDDPAWLVSRFLDRALLSIPGADFAALRFVPWLAAVAFCVLFARVVLGLGGGARGGAPDGAPDGAPGGWLARGALVALVFWVFSPAFGMNWLFAARLRVFLPPLSFLLGLAILRGGGRRRRRWHWRWRFAAAAACAQLAIFSEKSGMLVWIALAPVVFAAARRAGTARPWVSVAWWILLGNLGTLACLVLLRTGMSAAPGLLGAALDDPLAVARFAAHAVGSYLPSIAAGTRALEVQAGVLLGLSAALVAATWVRRDDPVRFDAAMPWLGCWLFGVGLAVLLTEWHVVSILTLPFVRESTWPGCLFVAGLVGLLQVHAPATARLLLPALLVYVLLATAVDWHRGWEHLKVVHSASRTMVAEVAFFGTGAALPDVPAPAVSRVDAAVLRAAGFLRGLPAFRSARVADYPRREPAADAAPGRLLAVETVAAAGEVYAYRFAPAPCLVLLTRARPGEPERVFQIAAPDFFGGGKRFPWRVAFPDAALFEPGEVVRAYGFDLADGSVAPLSGSHRFGPGGFERVVK